jgi:hypothetical protein
MVQAAGLAPDRPDDLVYVDGLSVAIPLAYLHLDFCDGHLFVLAISSRTIRGAVRS